MTNEVLLENYKMLHNVPMLKECSVIISEEDFSSFVRSIGNFFTRRLEDIKDFFRSEVSAYKIKTDPYIMDMVKTYNSKQKRLANVNYVVVSKKLIPYNEVFAKSLYDTANIIVTAAKELDKIIINDVNKCDDFISKIIADPDYYKSTRPFIINNERNRIMDLCYKATDDIINPKLRRDRVQVQDAIPNITSIQEIVNQLSSILQLDMYKNGAILDKISKAIKQKIDILINNIKKGEVNDMSKQVLSQLATEIEDCAKMVTLYSTILYIISQTAASTTHLIDILLEEKK